MVKTLNVFLAGVWAGTLDQTTNGDVSFSYRDEYRGDPASTPLSLSMPLSASRYKKRAVLPFFQGLLPDSDIALRALGSRFGVSWRNPFALLEFMGADLSGALEVLPEERNPSTAEVSSVDRQLSESEVGRILRSVITEYQSGNATGADRGYFSVAGAQPKIALRRDGDQWSIPDAQHPTTHIIKPSAGDFPRVDVAEFLTMNAARSLGLAVAHCELMEVDGISCFVTERYDRVSTSGHNRRLHQEDLAQALSVLPQNKYQRLDGGPGLAAIAQLLGSVPEGADRIDAMRRFYHAVVFNTVAGCTDAHAKNYSLMLSGSRVTLAPLYDLVTFAGYWDGQSPITMAMSIEGEYRADRISPSSLASGAARFGWGDESAGLVDSLRRGVAPAFEQWGTQLIITSPETAEFVERVVHRVRQLPLVATDF